VESNTEQAGGEVQHREGISDERMMSLLQRFISYCSGKRENVDVKKMRGKWEGYHRVRIGKIRIILKADVEARTIVVDRMDFRGGIYK